MQPYGTGFWKRMPFLRILLPLIAGIIIHFHCQLSILFISILSGVGIVLMLLIKTLSTSKLYHLRWISGVGLNLIFFSIGCLLVNRSDIQLQHNWIGNTYKADDAIIVTIQEPLVAKPKSYKALASVEQLIKNDTVLEVDGDILIYFQKDSLPTQLKYGTQILIRKSLQPIRNSGNPGGFDYQQYCAFQDIHHQVFLKREDYQILSTTNAHWFNALLINTRDWVLSILRQHISGKNEVAVAEALLIGYRDDLDRELVQVYSNTGVVHIIAISGLHLGMIYWALQLLFRLFKPNSIKRLIQPIAIIFVLWMFSFIAGAVPSILRSAVMFTCIVIGDSMGRRTNIYNTLSASAFIMLLINPFYLWDVGFQLSFAAVLSIVAFSRHVTNWFYFQNKSLRYIWNMCAVTLSAQLLTLPVILYHFHQFPNLFLFTNVLIVPLSGLILFAELLLLIVSFVPVVAGYVGKVVDGMIWLMNLLIERTDQIPFAVTDGIQITLVQTVALYFVIIFIALWLLNKNKRLLWNGLACLLLLLALRSWDLIQVNQQQKLIVYNVPQHTAIDVIEGNRYQFIGDSSLAHEGFLKNFHLKPSRVVNRMNEGVLTSLFANNSIIRSNKKKIVIVDQALPHLPETRQQVDVVIVSKNPRLYMDQLVKHFDCKMVVFDATNPLWKIRLWKKDCDSLHLRHYSVPEQGAFVMDL